MKNIITGLMAVFNAAPAGVHNAFWLDIGGRLFFGDAPAGTNLSDGPYAVLLMVSDVDDDPFAGTKRDVYVQFSLFSGASSPAEILDMDAHLTALFKNVTFTVTGWTVVSMTRVNGSGPINVPANVEDATEGYWQTDVDFEIAVNK